MLHGRAGCAASESFYSALRQGNPCVKHLSALASELTSPAHKGLPALEKRELKSQVSGTS